MQCYESELMRLQLMNYLGAAAPGTRAEALWLDETLADAELQSLSALLTLAPAERTALVGRVLERAGTTAAGARERAA